MINGFKMLNLKHFVCLFSITKNKHSLVSHPTLFFKGYLNTCTDHHSIMHTTNFQENAILTDASFLFFFFGAGLQMAKTK